MALGSLNDARKKNLTTEELAMLEREFENQKKKVSVVGPLLFFLGIFGAHRFYLGQTGYGVAMLLQTLTLGILTLTISSFIWWCVEVFIVWKEVDKVNSRIEAEIIDRILAHRTAKAQ